MDSIPSPSSPFHESMREAERPLRPELQSEIGFDVRATELRLDTDRQRMRTGNAAVDPFDITDIYKKYAPTGGDPKKGNIDREIDFNWKRYETYGKADYAEQRGYYDQGWRPVMHGMFPGRFAPTGTNGPVIVKDMILMERPMRLTVQAKNEEMLQATRLMEMQRKQMAATPDGQAPRMVLAHNVTREDIEIPE